MQYEFGIKGCLHENLVAILLRIFLGVALHILCSYITFPLYALVTQVNTSCVCVSFSIAYYCYSYIVLSTYLISKRIFVIDWFKKFVVQPILWSRGWRLRGPKSDLCSHSFVFEHFRKRPNTNSIEEIFIY